MRTSERNRPASILAWSSPISTCTTPGSEATHQLLEEAGDEHRASFAVDLGRDLDPDRQLQVGADQLDVTGLSPKQQTGEDRQRAGA